LWRRKRRGVTTGEQTYGFAGPYGIGVRWDHGFLCIYVYSGIFGNSVKKITAWLSSAPWLPLIEFSVLATVVHIPLYIVLLVGASYAVWAYRERAVCAAH